MILTKRTPLFFIFFIVLCSQFTFTISVKAEDPTFDFANLSNSNFTLSIGGLPENIHKYVGIADLDRVEQINTINIDNTTRLATFRAFVYQSVVFWTEARPENAVTANKVTVEKQWLRLITANSETFKGGYKDTPYVASYENYLNPQVAAAAQGFSGDVQLNAQAQSLVPSMLDFGNAQYQITGKEFTSSLNGIVVMGKSAQAIGTYTTVVQESGQFSLSARDVPISDSAARTQAAGGADALSSQIIKSNLGFFRQPIPNPLPNLQVGGWSLPGAGVSVKNGMYLSIIPDVKLIKEDLKVRSQTIGVDTVSDAFGGSPPRIITAWCTNPEENNIDRVIGWNVQNYAIKVDLRIEYNLYSKYEVKQIVDPATPSLEIPEVQINDQIIESKFNGQTGAEILYQSETPTEAFFADLWADYWFIIIPVGVLILAVLAFVAFGYINGATGGALGAAIGNKIRSKSGS